MARAYVPVQPGNETLSYAIEGTNPIEPTTVDSSSTPPLPTFNPGPAANGFVACVYVIDSAGRMRFDYDIAVTRSVWFINSITVTPPDTDGYELLVVVVGGPLDT